MSELKQDLLRLGGTLLAITVAVALCLGVVDGSDPGQDRPADPAGH